MDFRLRKDAGRRVGRARRQAEQDAEERAYWLSRPPEERIEAAAFMSRRLHRLTRGGDFPRIRKEIGRRVPRSLA